MNSDSLVEYVTNAARGKTENIEIKAVDTPGGRFQIDWDREEPLTRFGSLAYFANYLHEGGLFAEWCDAAPLNYTSHNAPTKRAVMGTIFLSILAGHTRYAHISSLDGEQVAADMLGIGEIVSHDSVSRSLTRGVEEVWEEWQMEQALKCFLPLTTTDYILDMDVTIKPLFGHQEGAVVSYNPHKPGRPSHAYHVFQIALLRIVLWVDVLPGDEHAGKRGMMSLWKLLHRLPRNCWPKLIRGDIGYGNQLIMDECEIEGVKYLFRLRITNKIKALVKSWLRDGSSWKRHPEGWESREGVIQLDGWNRARNILIIRKRKTPRQQDKILPSQSEFEFVHSEDDSNYEYEVLCSNQDESSDSWYPRYRQRSNGENINDELKNQWCWSGFTTQDLRRCRIMARTTALIANWWNIFCRLAEPEEHKEAITSRPRLLENLGRMTFGGGQRHILISCKHSESDAIRCQFTHVASVLQKIRLTATQLGRDSRWALILSVAFYVFLKGCILHSPWDTGQLLLSNL